MSFNNYGAIRESNNISIVNSLPPSEKPVPPTAKPVPTKGVGSRLVLQKNVDLNAPMIGRVYKAKPGCSACGKKVS